MKRSIFIIIMLIIITSLIPIINAEIGVKIQEPIILVQREIQIENAGIVWINDEFSIWAPTGDDLEIQEFWVGFNAYYSSERRTFEIWQDSNWVTLTYVEETKNGFEGYKIFLPSKITLTESTALRIRASYLFIDTVSEGQDRFSAQLPVYPVLEYNISSIGLHIDFPTNAEFTDTVSDLNFTGSVQNSIWTLEHQSYIISSYAEANVTASYIPSLEDEYILDCERMERMITVKQGSIMIEDSYIILNIGSPKNRIHLKLPLEASEINARDGVGPLQVSSSEENSHLDIFVTSRYYLLNGNRWGFTVYYTMPKSDFITTTEGLSSIRYSNSKFPFYVRELFAVVTRPESERFTLEYGALLPSERPEIVSDLPNASIMPMIRPFAGLLVLIVVVSVQLFLRREKPASKFPKLVDVKVPSLSDYISQSKERISILKEFESLDSELNEKNILREEFDRRNADLNRRLNELVRSIKQLETTIDTEDPDLNQRLREIRNADEDLKRISQDLRNLDIRLRARRVSRRDYERRKIERIRRRSQAIKKIERAIESLSSRE